MGRDVIVANGRVIDPANKMDGVADVHIRDGSILAVSAGLAKAAPADGSGERGWREVGVDGRLLPAWRLCRVSGR